IRRFGSVEQALDHAEEVERKSYRESLLNNRDVVLLSKQLVTIDCDVPVDLDVESMRAQEPDAEACRKLFTELEFTTLVKDFLSASEPSEKLYTQAAAAEDLEPLLKKVKSGSPLAIAIAAPQAAEIEELEDEETDEEQSAELPLIAVNRTSEAAAREHQVAISVETGSAIYLCLDGGPAAAKLEKVLADPKLPKSVHDLKTAIHAFGQCNVKLDGVRDDSLLYSYLLDPTYSSHRLADVALRRFNLNLEGSISEAADMTARLTRALREEVQDA